MKLLVDRFKDDGKTSLGMMLVDGVFECFVVEDTLRDVKIAGKTCIPSGEYEVKLRDAGGMTKKYAKKYDFHEGMLWLQDVPGFEWVYIHTGNTAEHTEGCLLVNAGVDSETMSGSKSRSAYVKLYKSILAAIKNGEVVTITVL